MPAPEGPGGPVAAGIAFTVLDGTIRWVALGIAALELVVAPQILKRAT